MLAYLFHLLEHTNKLGEALSVGAIITKGSKGHSGTEGAKGREKKLSKNKPRSPSVETEGRQTRQRRIYGESEGKEK